MSDNPEEFFSRIAEEYAEEHSLDNMPEDYFELLEKFSELVEDGRILDAGCGPGKDVEYFAGNGFNAVGVDLASGAVEYAKENREGEFYRDDIRDLEFKDESFDGVWCNTVMQFFKPKEAEEAISELSRTLKKGGTLYITFKLGEGYIIRKEKGSQTKRYLISEGDAIETLKENGLEILETRKSPLNGLTVFNVFAEKK